MGELSNFYTMYFIFIIIALVSGLVFWVINKYRIPALLAFVIAMFVPLYSLFLFAQGDTDLKAYNYLLEGVRAGDTWARLDAALHVYLVLWLLFLVIRGLVHLILLPSMKERYKKWFAGISSSSKTKQQMKKAE